MNRANQSDSIVSGVASQDLTWSFERATLKMILLSMKSWAVKKFGLEDCSLNNLLWHVFWMMRCLTINLDSKSGWKASIFAYAFDTISLLCYSYTYVLSVIYNLFWRYSEHDITSLVIITSLGFSSSITTVKLAYTFANRKTLMQIIDDYRSIDLVVDPSSRYGRSVLSMLRDVKKRALVFWCCFVGCCISYALIPLARPGRNLPENALRPFGLEPTFESPNYEICYTINMIGGFEIILVPANVTVLLIVLVGYVEAHLIALSIEFHQLWNDVVTSQELTQNCHKSSDKKCEDSIETDDKNARIKDKLIFLVKVHSEFVRVFKNLGHLFEGCIVFEFVLTMVSLCAILLVGIRDTYMQLPYTIIQLLVDVLIGQRLLDAGMLLETSVYDCGWENLDASNMKTIQIVLQCSQRPLRLTAGGVMTLCFESFMSFVKTVYSACTTLSKIMN